MKTFIIIFTAGLFTGINFTLMSNQVEIGTLLFYVSLFAVGGFLMYDYRDRSKLKRRIILQSKYSPLGITGASFCTLIGLIHLISTLFSSPQILDLVLPIATLASGFCILLATITYREDVAITKTLVMATVFPIYWLVLEIVFMFKEHLVNPILTDYIMMLFPAMATSLAYYYFVSLFCSTKPRNFFTPALMMSIYLTIALLVVTLIMTITKSQPLDLILHHFRICLSCFAVQIFLVQFYSRTVHHDDELEE